MFVSNLSGSGELLWEYPSIFSRIYTSSSRKKGAASDLNVLEQLEMPEMVFAGSREAQKRVKPGRGKWQKTSKNWLTWPKWVWRKLWIHYHSDTENSIFCLGIICNKFHIFSILWHQIHRWSWENSSTERKKTWSSESVLRDGTRFPVRRELVSVYFLLCMFCMIMCFKGTF